MNGTVLCVNTGGKKLQLLFRHHVKPFFHCVKQALKIQELFQRLMNAGLKYDIISAEWGRTTEQYYERGGELIYNGV